jgi:hypothetical protein
MKCRCRAVSPQRIGRDNNSDTRGFHNHVFDSLDALEEQLIQALKAFEEDPQRMHSIAGWDWIINAVSTEK